MGIILKFLGGPFGMYALLAVAAALTGSVAYGTYQHLELKAEQAELKSKIRDLDIALDAITSKDEVIADQGKALVKWKAFADERSEAEQAAIKTSQQEAYNALVATQKLHELEKKDYALPDCAKYLAIDVALVCPEHGSAVRLRQRQAFGDEGSSSGSSSAGSKEAGRGTHQGLPASNNGP